jgi:hypothetical protein
LSTARGEGIACAKAAAENAAMRELETFIFAAKESDE